MPHIKSLFFALSLGLVLGIAAGAFAISPSLDGNSVPGTAVTAGKSTLAGLPLASRALPNLASSPKIRPAADLSQ